MPAADLPALERIAREVASEWGMRVGPAFALARHSFVAAAGADAVLKATPPEDDESDEEGDALELWDGDGAVRSLRRDHGRRVLLLERARPGTDLSGLPEDEATAIAVAVGRRLWRPAGAPFRWIGDHVPGWLDDEERRSRPSRDLIPLARELYASLDVGRARLVHGDFHHHNILRHGERYVAIDPKPYLGDREFDLFSFLRNPLAYRMTNRAHVEQRIAEFVASGLDDFKIRAWTVIRGAYLGLDADEAAVARSLLD